MLKHFPGPRFVRAIDRFNTHLTCRVSMEPSERLKESQAVFEELADHLRAASRNFDKKRYTEAAKEMGAATTCWRIIEAHKLTPPTLDGLS
jgi:hypothetical protein